MTDPGPTSHFDLSQQASNPAIHDLDTSSNQAAHIILLGRSILQPFVRPEKRVLVADAGDPFISHSSGLACCLRPNYDRYGGGKSEVSHLKVLLKCIYILSWIQLILLSLDANHLYGLYLRFFGLGLRVAPYPDRGRHVVAKGARIRRGENSIKKNIIEFQSHRYRESIGKIEICKATTEGNDESVDEAGCYQA